MIKWTPYSFLRITVFFIAGILFYIYTGLEFDHYFELFACFISAYALLYFTIPKERIVYFKPVFGIIALISVFLFGILLTKQKTNSNDANHILNFNGEIYYYKGLIVSELTEKAKSYKAELLISEIKNENGWGTASGRILIYFAKDSTTKMLKYGDRLIIKGSPNLITPPSNPNEFDYKRYLRFHNIYHQHFVRNGNYLVCGYQPINVIKEKATAVRNYCDKILRKYIHSSREYKIASALILGIRSSLDNEIKEAYSNAGAMHVLAVSGLHVGIVFQFLMLILGRLRKIKYGEIILAFILLVVLWFYAFVTALSPSVLRAVTMFSFIIVARAFGRQTNIYNILAVSAFCLLCFNPYLIMEVGFQLSYMAVFGIVYLQPKLYGLVEIYNWVGDQIWAITCVSIAAQVATFPIALLYFHQFPTCFLFSNLVVIPSALLILCLGFTTIGASFIPLLAKGFGFLLEKLIWLLNQFIFTIEKLPFALIKGIDISVFESWLIYAIVIIFLIFIYFKKIQFQVVLFSLLFLFSIFQIIELSIQKNQKRFVVYNIHDHSAIDFIDGFENELICDSILLNDKSKLRFHIFHHWWNKGIRKTNITPSPTSPPLTPPKGGRTGHPLSPTGGKGGGKVPPLGGFRGAVDLIVWNGYKILLLNKDMEFPGNLGSGSPNMSRTPTYYKIDIDFIVLQNNAHISLRKLQEHFIFTKLIIDSSNKWYYGKKLLKEAKAYDIPCFSVRHQGAFVWDI
ncbi:MAG: ComEC family competence protein [Cytophagales bacterium]|nr:ComEC family competence protein [Cytophagales bacterium]